MFVFILEDIRGVDLHNIMEAQAAFGKELILEAYRDDIS